MERSRRFYHDMLRGNGSRLPPLLIGVHEDDTPPVLIYTDAAFRWRKRSREECDSASIGLHYVPHDVEDLTERSGTHSQAPSRQLSLESGEIRIVEDGRRGAL